MRLLFAGILKGEQALLPEHVHRSKTAWTTTPQKCFALIAHLFELSQYTCQTFLPNWWFSNVVFKILEFFIFILRTVSFALVQIQLLAKLASHVTEKGTAVWIYIVSVLGGLALLALVGLALHKVGAHYSRETVRLKAKGMQGRERGCFCQFGTEDLYLLGEHVKSLLF